MNLFSFPIIMYRFYVFPTFHYFIFNYTYAKGKEI